MVISKTMKCIKIGEVYYVGLYEGKIQTTDEKLSCLGTNNPTKEVNRIKAVIKKKQNLRHADADIRVIDY